MIDPSSIHITRIWWILALETFNSILVRFIPSTLPKISSFLSAFSVYIFFAYCLCVYMFTNELLWMLLCRYISSLISLCTSHFPHFDEYLNDFYRMKNTYRNRIILHSTTWIIVHHFIGDWVVILEHKSAYLIDTHECQHTQLGFQNQLMESFFS